MVVFPVTQNIPILKKDAGQPRARDDDVIDRPASNVVPRLKADRQSLAVIADAAEICNASD